ncbi:hypothetical protein AbraIFM66951_006294 [Aspergillus brasiliensis]|uniref:Uncharacterized protein n=1 Tax=Aspergillus brasiliensis TaxID=319629 RepID=A0A9W6DIM1_9EURO|nr:hypothetical protein AbraCBS73388_004188 [Aspergillus brasiliensis]GKZ40763.1 hypothetical protein AbraIFM66951_006294 [Aspergillus brasiliensis]
MSCLWSQPSLLWHLERRSSSFTYRDIIEPTAYNETTGIRVSAREDPRGGQTACNPRRGPDRAPPQRPGSPEVHRTGACIWWNPRQIDRRFNTFLERCKATGVDTPTLCRTHLEVALAAMDMKTSASDDTLLDRLHTAIAYGTEWDSLRGSNDKLIDSY